MRISYTYNFLFKGYAVLASGANQITIPKALRTKHYDTKKLIDYAQKINNTGVIRRLGYLCDTLDIPLSLPQINTRNYLLLDPTLPKITTKNAKWRLIINEDIGVLE